MDTTQVATKVDLKTVETGLKADLKAVEMGLKSDLKTVETGLKADLKTVETGLKADLKTVEMGLKADLKAVRKELKSDIKSLRQEVLKVEERVENLEEGQVRIERILKRMEITLDGFVGRVDNLTTDNEVGTHHTRELQKRVDNHEERLQKVESLKHTI